MEGTDLLYLGRSPFGSTDDRAITFSNFLTSVGAATPAQVQGNVFNGGYSTTEDGHLYTINLSPAIDISSANPGTIIAMEVDGANTGSVIINVNGTQASVDSILISLASLDGTGGTTLYAGWVVDLSGGTSAAPSSAATAAIATLESNGNTVTTN
ncbi:unnamed protein product [Sphagnum jensenii]|uniref:Uncharacterized protein n=1 Tax=Sphagnum jensenii TaxID=128206 RepID=A0ABP0VIM3_9BRYO